MELIDTVFGLHPLQSDLFQCTLLIVHLATVDMYTMYGCWTKGFSHMAIMNQRCWLKTCTTLKESSVSSVILREPKAIKKKTDLGNKPCLVGFTSDFADLCQVGSGSFFCAKKYPP
mmetsp:Transcript_99513/g.171301  ORF Transcript_99513/g.171301 Transcript_99513/m.171301 type:complete len:116 (-) Transcript_99513:1053-1400(-)